MDNPILTLREIGRLLFPKIPEYAAYRRAHRAAKAGVLPGLIRLNGKMYGVSRQALEEWLAGRSRHDSLGGDKP